MRRDRLTAFSDGVIAIIITIMVLDLKVPQGTDLKALTGQAPVFLSYVLSFIYIAIFWNNHHHLLHTVARVSGPILWANNNLLFWLSLVPFATGWMGGNHFAPLPTAIYGLSLQLPGIAWALLQRAIIRTHGATSVLAKPLGSDVKGEITPFLYVTAIALAFVSPWISIAIYMLVAAIWLIPTGASSTPLPLNFSRSRVILGLVGLGPTFTLAAGLHLRLPWPGHGQTAIMW
jgi:uncharacterized membrane protein